MTKLILCLQFLWTPLLCCRFSRDEARFMSSVSLDTHCCVVFRASSRENLSSGFANRVDSKPACAATEAR